jgi:hypothetical protein
MQHGLIVPTKVYARDLLQGVFARRFVPDRIGPDFENAYRSVGDAPDVADVADVGIDVLAMNREQREALRRGKQQRAQSSDADLRLARLALAALSQGRLHECREWLRHQLATVDDAGRLKPVEADMVGRRAPSSPSQPTMTTQEAQPNLWQRFGYVL